MDAIEFLIILAALAALLRWYLQNARARSDGAVGLFALMQSDSEQAEKRRSYRIKSRAAPRRQARSGADASALQGPARAAYRRTDDGTNPRRRYKTLDDVRYRVKDKAAGL